MITKLKYTRSERDGGSYCETLKVTRLVSLYVYSPFRSEDAGCSSVVSLNYVEIISAAASASLARRIFSSVPSRK
jgi:hypothetical protein